MGNDLFQKAIWIWKPAGVQINDYAFFRKSFDVTKTVTNATLHITAHHYYKLAVNGDRVSGYGSPVPSNPEPSKYYVSYDLTASLVESSLTERESFNTFIQRRPNNESDDVVFNSSR